VVHLAEVKVFESRVSFETDRGAVDCGLYGDCDLKGAQIRLWDAGHTQYQRRNGNRGIESFRVAIAERSQYQCERRIEPLGRLRDERVDYQ
jgi:hypothetical protein